MSVILLNKLFLRSDPMTVLAEKFKVFKKLLEIITIQVEL